MAYVEQIWKDRQVQYPNRYVDQNENILYLTRSPGTITENGSLFNAEKMNHIEEGIKEIDNNMIYFTESTTLNDLVIKSNLLGNNSKIDASEIAIINSDNSVKKLDDYLEEVSTISNTQETFAGYWIDNSGTKFKKYIREIRYQKSSINPGDKFDLGLNKLNVNKYLSLECFYDVGDGFVSMPFTANSSGNNTPQHLSSRIIRSDNPSNSTGNDYVDLYGNLSYGGAGTFIIRVEYTKTSESE